MRRVSNLNQMIRASMLISIGLILPYVFHGINNAGSIFLPMHIPVLIGGFALNPYYAACVGVITPILSNFFTGMPPIPFLYIMIFELATYGAVISILHNKSKMGVYPSLITGMIFGRMINVFGSFIILHILMNKPFKFSVILSGLFLKGLPGIIIQIIFIPVIIYSIQKFTNSDFAIH